jgi:hypothetical protein
VSATDDQLRVEALDLLFELLHWRSLHLSAWTKHADAGSDNLAVTTVVVFEGHQHPHVYLPPLLGAYFRRVASTSGACRLIVQHIKSRTNLLFEGSYGRSLSADEPLHHSNDLINGGGCAEHLVRSCPQRIGALLQVSGVGECQHRDVRLDLAEVIDQAYPLATR